MTAVKIIQCQPSPRSTSGSRSSRNQCPLGTDHEGCDGSENNPVPTQPTFSPGVPVFSQSMPSRHRPRGAPRTARGFSHALRHCPRGISYMLLALSTRRPTFSQWVPAFSQSHVILALTTKHPMLDNCKRTDFGNDHMVLSNCFDHSIGAVKIVYKRAINVSSTRPKAACCSQPQKMYRVGRFRAQPWYSGRRCRAHPQTTNKPRRTPPIDQESEENVTLQVVLLNSLTNRMALSRLSKSAPQTCPSTRSKTVCCPRSQKMYRVGVSAHTTQNSGRRCRAHPQTTTKPRRTPIHRSRV